MPPVTNYEVWQHKTTGDRWVVRLEYSTLTGLYGPLPKGAPGPTAPDLLDFEDHPDDLEWIVRAAENFRIVTR